MRGLLLLLCAAAVIASPLALPRQRQTTSLQSASLASRAVESKPRDGIKRIPNEARHVMASAISGAVGVTVLAPIQVVQVNMLLNNLPFRKALSSLSVGWFRGNGADSLAAAARIGITMPAFAFYKRALVEMSGGDGTQPAPKWVAFAAGALAGITATVATFPLEVVRTRLAAGCEVGGGVAGCLANLAQTEGLASWYAGLATTLAGVLPFNAIKLSSYDIMRAKALQLYTTAGDTAGIAMDSISLPAATTAAIGAAGGVLAATSCFPLEVIRRRQMMGEYAGLSVYGAIAALVRKEGAGALMKGANLNIVKVALGNSIGFVLYEACKDVLQVDDRQPPWRRRQTAA
jgi:solute carrier family 25 phosphate transporter 23/24/25/41